MRWSTGGIASVLALALVASCGFSVAPALAARSASGVRMLPCREFIGTQPPERQMRVVLGVVALPASPQLTRGLQTAPSGLHDPHARLFASGNW